MEQTSLLFVMVSVAAGVVAGMVSGAFGIGGGTVLVPLLALAFGLSQHQAQGTALAVMLPPVFILAVWRYWQEGHVRVAMALWIALGFVIGALLGAHAVQSVSDVRLKQAFGWFLIGVGMKMALGR